MPNSVAVIILAALLIETTLHFIADLLNLKHLSSTLPVSFEGIYDPSRYEASQRYLRTNTYFSWIDTFVNLAALLLFWFLKGFNFIDTLVKEIGMGPIPSGIAFIGILVILKSLLNFPFGLYHTFVIEEKYGFNKTTWKTYLLDRLKEGAIGIIIGIPLLGAILWFFQYMGAAAWLYCWGAVFIFSMAVRFIFPTWIMPLFNKFTPLEDGSLKQKLMDFSSRIRFPVSNVFIMDGSKRSTKSNAFFTGFGKNKRIVLFDTLVEKHNESELIAILGHEMGHYKLKHIWMQTFLGVLHTGVLFFLLSIFISWPALFDAFYMESVSVYGGLIFFGMLYAPMDFFLGMLIQAYSRRNEYQADRFAVENTKDPQSLGNALKQLSVQNLSNLTPHPFYVALNYSHPPVLERIKTMARKGE